MPFEKLHYNNVKTGRYSHIVEKAIGLIVMLRVIANTIIFLFVLWSETVAIASFLDIAIHFPWIIGKIEDIPLYRLQSLRVAILLTFAHYGVLHLLGRNKEYLPIHFLVQYLFYLVLSGSIIFYSNNVGTGEYTVLVIVIVLWLFCILASRPLNRDYFKNR